MKKNSWNIYTLLLLAVTLTWRAGADGYEGEKWALVDAKRVLQAAKTITLTNYPDCDEATIEKRMVRVYRADGTGECQDETYVKVLTEKGKRGNRGLSLWYMLPYSIAEAVKVEVIKPDGEVVPVDLAAKLNSLTLYRSQIGTEELQIVSEYARRWRPDQAVERVWTASSKSEFLKMFGPGKVFETDPHHHRKAAKAVQQGGR